MTNSRPSRPRPSKPSFGSSSSSSDSDKRMGADAIQPSHGISGRKISKQATEKFFEGKKFTSGNTYVRQGADEDEGKTILRLYNTQIAIRDTDGSIQLYSDGYQTVTTKERLNSVISPVGGRITQVKGRWIYTDSSGVQSSFDEGMKISKSGKRIFVQGEAKGTPLGITNRSYEGQKDN